MHRFQRNTENREAGKPDMVAFYNTTKSGVDNLDKLEVSVQKEKLDVGHVLCFSHL